MTPDGEITQARTRNSCMATETGKAKPIVNLPLQVGPPHLHRMFPTHTGKIVVQNDSSCWARSPSVSETDKQTQKPASNGKSNSNSVFFSGLICFVTGIEWSVVDRVAAKNWPKKPKLCSLTSVCGHLLTFSDVF